MMGELLDQANYVHVFKWVGPSTNAFHGKM